jgi:hypothetical protein
MAQTPEAKVKAKIRRILDKHKAYYCQMVTSGFGGSGHPDFLVGFKGRIIGIEAKAGKGVPTELQWTRLAEIQAIGGFTLVVDETNLDSFEELIHALSQYPEPPKFPTILPQRLERTRP